MAGVCPAVLCKGPGSLNDFGALAAELKSPAEEPLTFLLVKQRLRKDCAPGALLCLKNYEKFMTPRSAATDAWFLPYQLQHH